jgi:hypothetical protein
MKIVGEQFFSHACFAAQQAGEIAIKALWFLADQEPWGHSLQHLLLDFSTKDQLPDLRKWIEAAAALDKLYIPTPVSQWTTGLNPGGELFPRGCRNWNCFRKIPAGKRHAPIRIV